MTTDSYGGIEGAVFSPGSLLCGRYNFCRKGLGGIIMGSTKGYLEYVLEQLSGLEDVTHRAMMGEYIIYFKGKVIGGIYDDRFLVKPTASAKKLMPDAPLELPYEGAKKMLLVTELDDREFLERLLNSMVEELLAPKKRK